MSSKKTDYLKMHDWTEADPWRLAEVSENFKKMDKKAKDLDSTMATTVSAAADAKSTANGIDAKATDALIKSTEAVQNVSTAVQKANSAESKATEAKTVSDNALAKAGTAESIANGVQTQFNQVVINGDSSVEAAQARVNTSGQTYSTLKQRLDSEHQEVTVKLADKAKQIETISLNIKDFGAVGNANYFNTSDKKYYQDSAYTIPASDNTSKIQAALDFPSDFMRTVLIPDGTYMVNAATKLFVRSNTRLIFSKNAKFVALASWRDISSILEVVNVENIEIINPTLVGDRDIVSFTTEGAGHGISARGVKRLTIQGGNISKCFTDGIYLNGVEDVLIEYLMCDGNRRQGLSLTSGKNFVCRNSTFKNTNGTSPMMGIDIEPNGTSDIFENIIFENIVTENNAASGLGINLNQLNNPNTVVDIIIRNWTDKGSRNAFSATHYTGSVSEASRITVVGLKTFNAKNAAIVVAGYKADGTAKLIIDKPVVRNPNASAGTNERFQNVAITIHTETTGYPAGLAHGNLEIIEPFIEVDPGKSVLRGIYIGYANPYKKIIIKDPIKISIGDEINLSANNHHNLIGFNNTSQGEVKIYDRYNVLAVNTNNTLVRNYSSAAYSKYTVTAASGTVLLKDWQRWDCVDEMIIIHDGGNGILTLSVEFPSTITFINETNALVTGTYSTNVKGAVLKVKKVKESVFRVTKEFGTWTLA